MEDLYDTLGVDKNATAEEIKEAYKKKAKQHHPDREGGSTEKMQAINKAYRVLEDPKSRERYDTTGSDEPETAFQDKFLSLVNQVLMQAIGAAQDVTKYDIVEHFKHYIHQNISSIKNQKIETSREINKLKEVKKRIKSKSDKTFVFLLDQNIDQKEKHMKLCDLEIDFFQKSLEVLTEYEYQIDTDDEKDFVQLLMANYRIT